MLTIDDLLEGAALPVAERPGYDVGGLLRRLAFDARLNGTAGTGYVAGVAQAGQRLSTVSRWVINAPAAAGQISRLADAPARPERGIDSAEGAGVFACLLFLTGHPESAQFWWQLSAGADNRIAMYCLHLHHLARGESREANHWRHELTCRPTRADKSVGEGAGIDELLLDSVATFASYISRTGSTACTPPTRQLEKEVDRIADKDDHHIVRHPDRQLADTLREFTTR